MVEADNRSLEELPLEEPKTKIIPVRGINFEVYEELPYSVGATVADLWIKTMMGTRSFENVDLTETLHEILLAVVVKPKLTMEFIKSNRCPGEFIGLAMKHFRKIIESFSAIGSEDVDDDDFEELDS